MIKLRSGLVVPGAPGRATIDADNRALVSGERNDLRTFFADPPTLVVIAAGSALEAHKSFRTIRGFPRRSVGHVDDVGIIRSHSDSHSPRPAAADAVVGAYLGPRLSAVV